MCNILFAKRSFFLNKLPISLEVSKQKLNFKDKKIIYWNLYK